MSNETQTLNRVEAIRAMKDGKKVTHEYFSDNEWITMDGGNTIVDENGYRLNAAEFWSYRQQSGSFENGWSIIEQLNPEV